MTRYLQNAAILSGKRNRTATATFAIVAEPAGLVKRKHGKLILPRLRFSKTWWQEHAAGLTLAAPEVPDQELIVSSAQPGSANQAPSLTVKAKRAVRTRQEQALETATRIAALETACAKVQEEFQNSFTWEERKLIAANSYYTERLAIAKENASMAQGEMRSLSMAARAAHVSGSTSQNWMSDHVNIQGYFSPSLWGTNPKLASLCGDVSVKRWA
jgi:hypothetical protein